MKKIVLDTNAYSRLAAGEGALLEVLGQAEVVYLSVFVLGELQAGFQGGKHARLNRQSLRDFMAAPTVKVLIATAETAEVFGSVKESLRKQGTPLPINDVWIAAHALETGSTLVTFDAHFSHVPGLRRWP